MKRSPSPELEALLDAIGPSSPPLDDDPAWLDALARGETPEGLDHEVWAPLEDDAVARMTRAAMAARDGTPSEEALARRPLAQAAARSDVRSDVRRPSAAERLWSWLRTPVAGVAVALAAAVLLWPTAPTTASLPHYQLEAGLGDRAFRGASTAAEGGVVSVSDGSVYRMVLRPASPVAGVEAALFLREAQGWTLLPARLEVSEDGAVRVDLRVDAGLPVGDVTLAVVLKPGASPTAEDVGKESTWEVSLRHAPGAGSSQPP